MKTIKFALYFYGLMKKILSVLTVVLTLASCSRKPACGPAVLIGDIQGTFNEAYVLSSPLDSFLDFLEVDVNDGHFELTIDDVNGFIDLVTVLDDEVFGARINALDTVRLTFRPEGDGHFDVIYDGANEAEGRIWTDWYRTYGEMEQYNIRLDRDPDITTEESLRLLAANDSLFLAKYDGQLSQYHIRRAALARDFLKAVLLEERAFYAGEDVYDDPDYVAMVKDIDPEDPYVLGSGMLPRWANYVKHSLGDDGITQDINFFKEYAGRIADSKVVNFLAGNISFTLRAEPQLFDDETCAEYLEALKEFCPEGQDIADRCADAFNAYKTTRPGADMPDLRMTATDGSEVLLSSLFGKVIYIDLWATWCGPCIRETPYMAALAERMKGQDDILCISISTDDTDEPWLKHLAKECPGWPQYRADPEAYVQFSKSLNISGIPRFIIIAMDGKIYDPDSIRPSDPDIDDVLLTAAGR